MDDCETSDMDESPCLHEHDLRTCNRVPVRIEAVSYHGDMSVYHLLADDGSSLQAKTPNDGARARPAVGARIWAEFDADDAFLLAP